MKGQIPSVVLTLTFFPPPFILTAEKKVFFDQPHLNLTMTHASVLFMVTFQTWPLTQKPKETVFKKASCLVSLRVVCEERTKETTEAMM